MSSINIKFGSLQRHRVVISRIIWLAMIVYFFGIERISIHSIPSAIALGGIAVIVLGILIRSISAGALHKNAQLSTSGIYAIVRNPLYVGSICMLIGLNIIIGNLVIAVVSVALFLATYIPTILNEEAGLRSAFPEETREYFASTPRIIPNILRIGALRDATWSGSQWYRNHEHNTIIAAIALVAALEIYNRYYAIH